MSLMKTPGGRPKGWKLMPQYQPKYPKLTETTNMEDQENATPKAATSQSTAPQPQGVNVSFEQLQMLMASMAQSIVAEFKKPSEEEVAKLANEKALLDRRRTEMVRIAREETARLQDAQARCPHLKENGKPSTGGQMFSDGHVRMFCLRCGKITEDYVPSALDMANGFGNVSDEFRGTGPEPPILQ